MKKHLAVVGALAAMLLVALPALAGASDISPTTVPVGASDASANITVDWTGLPASSRVFITQCFKATTDPTFDPTASCSNISELTINPGSNPGSGSTSFPVFHGQEPSGDDGWGCFGAGETPPSGIQAFTTCYIRITDTSESNVTDQVSFPFTFNVGGTVTPPPDVPESSLPIALPAVGVAVAGASLFMMRRRRTRAAV